MDGTELRKGGAEPGNTVVVAVDSNRFQQPLARPWELVVVEIRRRRMMKVVVVVVYFYALIVGVFSHYNALQTKKNQSLNHPHLIITLSDIRN